MEKGRSFRVHSWGFGCGLELHPVGLLNEYHLVTQLYWTSVCVCVRVRVRARVVTRSIVSYSLRPHGL